MITWFSFLVGAFALCLSGGTAFAQSAPADPILRPGDALKVTVWRQPEMSGEFLISEGGTISHPLFQGVKVTDAPVSQLAERVRDFLRRYETDPQVVLEPLLRVAVAGEVRVPSLYRLTPTTTIAQAVAQAGGMTDRAKVEEVRVTRGGTTVTVDLRSPESGMAGDPVKSGDYIVVPRAKSIYRDYVVPTASVTAALAALINIFIRL